MRRARVRTTRKAAVTGQIPESTARTVRGGRQMGAGLLLLGDSRLPAGGHAHSGGLENAVARGEVHDLDTLTDFLLGRLYSTGAVQAAFAACAALVAGPYALDADGPWAELDAELTR